MINSKYFVFSFAMIVLVIWLVTGNFVTPVRASSSGDITTPTPMPTGTPSSESTNLRKITYTASIEEQDDVKSFIQAYFELRYQALSAVQPEGYQLDGFRRLVSDGTDARAFLDAELSKLALEIKYAELNRSRYADYKYFLDFSSITMDAVTQLATVSVIENNETISEISAEHSPERPTIAQMSGLQHTIVLRKEQNQWRIVSDEYNDFLWRTLRQKGKSAEEILNELTTMKAQPNLEASPESVQIAPAFTLPADTSTHAYDRAGAVAYAQNHGPRENYNPNYDNWDDGDHGDCTNFVSQAIYEGGNASMAYCDPAADPDYCPASGASTRGWYFTFLGDTHRASAWSHVDAFYNFVATEGGTVSWNEGPEGYLLPSVPEGQFPSGLMLGDVIQYNESDAVTDDTWEHAAIVVGFDEAGDPLVASHSPNYSSIHFANVVAHKKTRFIHIERIDISTPRGFDSEGIQASYYNDVEPATIQYEVPIYWKTFTSFVNAASALKPYIAFNTGINSPASGVHGTFWSAHWDGPLHVAQDGNYIFYFKNLDDGARIYIDDLNTPLLETWKVQGFHNYESEPIALTAGNHNLRVEYAQGPHFDGGLIFEWGLENVFREKMGPYSEAASTPTAPTVIASLRASPNPVFAPASVKFTVKFSEPVTGVDSADFHLTTSGLTGSAVTDVSGSGAFYTITVNTGVREGLLLDGTLRLDVLDNNTIIDLSSTSLSAEFTGGETYNIDHRAPLPQAVVVASAPLPNAASIDYLVTFSEPVTGVDVTDFRLNTTGVTGANIASLSGSSATYTVTVNTGSGNGTIQLDLLADGTILDSASMPLTTGFSSGETYTAVKNVTISGYVGAAGVTLTYFDGAEKTAVSDETRSYSITVPYGWSGTITPTKPGYSFLPASRTHANVTSNLTYQSFSANVEIFLTISGNAGLPGVRLNFVNDGNEVAISDENGNYSITIPYGWSGTVTPSKGGYTFLPSSHNYSDLIEDQANQDYSLPALSYIISGNAGIGGATLSYVDGTAKTVTADANGDYSIVVPVGWSGTVTPTLAGYTFSPQNRSYSNLTANQTSQDYTATFVDTTAPAVVTFTVYSPTSSLNIPIADFTASDDVGVAGYMITQSATPPSAGAAGWSSTAPATYPVSANGSYTLYPWAKDAMGNVSALFGSPVSVVVNDNVVWNTFVGGDGWDAGYAFAPDGSGGFYVSGRSTAGWGSPVRAYTGDYDVFVARVNSSGALVWNTFLGGSDRDDYSFNMTVDASGNVYVMGRTNNVTWGSNPKRAYTAGEDGFVAKLNSSGVLQWHTFMGGSGADTAGAIAVDASGNVYVGGQSSATWGSPLRAYTSGVDGYVAKLNSSGVLQWNTFLGASAEDIVYGLALDGSGNIHVTGSSGSTWGSPVRAYTGDVDGFAAKLSSAGAITWNAFFGGSGRDIGSNLILDGSGNIYITGMSYAAWGSPINAYNAGMDGMFVKLNSSGALVWHTFLGGSGSDQVYGIKLDGSGNIYLAGASSANWGNPLRAYTADFDATVVKLNSSGGLLMNTFLGGSGTDKGYGIFLGSDGSIYTNGYSSAGWGNPVRPYAASVDTFIVKLSTISP